MPEEKFQKIIQMAQENKEEQVETALTNLIKQYPDFVPALLWLGDILLDKEKVAQSLKLLRKAVKIEPFNGWAKLLFASALMRSDRFYLAREYLIQASYFLPEEVEIYRSLGWVKVMLGNTKKGIETLKKALSLSPNNILIYADLASAENAIANFSAAKKWVQKILSKDSKHPLAKMLMRSIKINQRNFQHLSPSGKKKTKKMVDKSEANILMRINLLIKSIRRFNSRDDLEEIAFELKKMGISGEINILDNFQDKDKKIAREYLKFHQKISPPKNNWPKNHFRSWVKILFDKKSSLTNKKKALVFFAQQGDQKSLEIIKKYLQQSEKKLSHWSKLALEECWSRLRSKKKGEPIVRIRWSSPFNS